LKRYRNLAGGGQIGAVLSALQGAGGFAREAALRKALAWSPAEWEQVKPILQESGRVRLVGADKIWDSQAFDELSARVVTLLQKLQEAAPWKPGWRREEIGKLLFVKTGRDDGLNDLLDELARSGELQRNGPLFLTAGHVPELPSQAAAAAEALLSDLAGDGFSPRDWDVVLAAHARDSKTAQMLEEHLFGSGRLERLTEKIAFLPGVLESARDTLQAQSQAQPFTASQAREWLATSRKYIIPVLEWMDHQGWTHRAGDQRIVRPATPSESS
jgi:selenocysteine-specific elongation factor